MKISVELNNQKIEMDVFQKLAIKGYPFDPGLLLGNQAFLKLLLLLGFPGFLFLDLC